MDHRTNPKLHFRGWVRLKPACVLLSLISTCSVYKPWCDLLKGLFVVKPLLVQTLSGSDLADWGGSCAFLSAYLLYGFMPVYLLTCLSGTFAHQPGALIFSVLKDAFLGRLAHFWFAMHCKTWLVSNLSPIDHRTKIPSPSSTPRSILKRTCKTLQPLGIFGPASPQAYQ